MAANVSGAMDADRDVIRSHGHIQYEYYRTAMFIIIIVCLDFPMSKPVFFSHVWTATTTPDFSNELDVRQCCEMSMSPHRLRAHAGMQFGNIFFFFGANSAHAIFAAKNSRDARENIIPVAMEPKI